MPLWSNGTRYESSKLDDVGSNPTKGTNGSVAQSVERMLEELRGGGSIPPRPTNAHLAQLDRVLSCEERECKFESCSGHQPIGNI